ncbi:MFS transporter [Bacillus methanolicus]|uniref:MFS transporter n=1 Tax=Bacillus methanolicus TaxID=1471 RepID=UPI00200BC4F7|nr:MFS transporter [Bacillus methanolicus]UQD52377.1 MFS transporter [Bacillus methanolicus]
MVYIEKGTKEYRKASLSLFLGGFVTFAILYTTQPLLPIFAKEFHVSASRASLSLSVSTGVLAFAMLVVAALSDAIGKKRTMSLSLFFTSILCLLTSLSPNFMILLLIRAILGIFIAGVPAIAMAYVAEEFNPKGIGQIMGLYISGTSIGGMAGRIITGVLTDLFTWRIALMTIGGISLIFSTVFWLTLPASRHIVKKTFDRETAWAAYKSHLSNKRIIALIMLSFLLMGSFVTLYNYIGFLLHEPPYRLSEALIGFIFVVYLFGTFSSIFMGKKADQYGRSLLLKISITIMVGGAIITLVPSLLAKIIGISIFTFGFFASHSIASAWVGDCAVNNKAQASSLYLLFYYIGSSLVGSIGGFFWTHFHWIGVISLILVLLMIGYPLALFAQRGEQISTQYHISGE